MHLAPDAFTGNDSRITFIAPDSTKTAGDLKKSNLPSVTYVFPEQRGQDTAIYFKGKLNLYQDLDYHYWIILAERCAGATYLHFDHLMFEGPDPHMVESNFDASHPDLNAENLTFKDMYISIKIDGETITFDKLSEKPTEDIQSVILVTDDGVGGFLEILQRIGEAIKKVFGALTRLVNAVVRIFKKK